MQIHIGHLIRDELRRQGRTNEWLADQIGVNIRTVNKIFLKQTIDTLQLYQISKALDTDFFSFYSDILRTLPDMG
jgi:plasmid maintenance system antidote protein VapI